MIRTFDALYDTPRRTVPGVAVAVYGPAAPEKVHAAAAWIGLTGNLPGVAVFHPRPAGPDALYRFRHTGSGMEVRARLDRAGIRDRVLIPHKKGFDVLVPDRGGRMRAAVAAYTERIGVPYEMSPGHFSPTGSNDQAKAREQFRSKVVTAEAKMQRRVIRFAAANPSFVAQLRQEGGGRHQGTGLTTEAFADHLQDVGVPGAEIVRAHGRRADRDVPRGTDFVGVQPVGRGGVPERRAVRAELAGKSMFLAPHPYTGTMDEDTPHVDENGDHYPILQIHKTRDDRLVLATNHFAAGERDWRNGVTHWAYPASWAELHALTADFPAWARHETFDRVKRSGLLGPRPNTKEFRKPPVPRTRPMPPPPPPPETPQPMSRRRFVKCP